MNRVIKILVISVSALIVIFLSSHRSASLKQADYRDKILNANQNTNAGQKAPSNEEWQKFKSDSELKIRENNTHIDGFKAKLENRGEKADPIFLKKIASLEEQLRFEKARLYAFEKSQSNWDSFMTGFVKEMDSITNELKDLTEYNLELAMKQP